MTSRVPRSDHADEAVLDAFAARLSRVDQELAGRDPHPLARPSAPHLHVVRGRAPRAALAPVRARELRPDGSGRRRTEPALIAAAVLLVAFGIGRATGDARVGAVPTGTPTGSSATSTESSASAASGLAGAPTPEPSASAAASAPPVPPPMSVDPPMDADVVGLRAAMAIVGWPCSVVVRVASDPIAPGLVAKLEAMGRPTDGFIRGDLDPLWSGSDPDAAARAFKGRRLVTMDDGGIWVLRPGTPGGGLLELTVQVTPAGSSLWRGGDVAWPIACAKASADPKILLSGHAGPDWPSGQVIDIEVVRLADPPARVGRPR